MLYTPIQTRSEFEARIRLSDRSRERDGTAEGVHVDFKFKQETKPNKQREFARDITQFANTEGGTLVIGVEAPKMNGFDTAKSIVSITDPGRLQDWMERAMSNYLYPAAARPRAQFFDPWGEGTVCALNVPPSINLVGVWRQCEAKGGVEYLYRTTTGKEWFTPSEIEMKISSSYARGRRLTLESLCTPPPKDIFRPYKVHLTPPLSQMLWSIHGLQHTSISKSECWVELGKRTETEFTLKLNNSSDGRAVASPIHLPYEYINAAWRTNCRHLALDLAVRIYRLGDARSFERL